MVENLLPIRGYVARAETEITTNKRIDHGDLVLKHATALIIDVVADQGLVARIGGDEFVVSLPGPFSPSPIEDTVREILHRTAGPLDLGGQRCCIGMSIGVAKSIDIKGDIPKTSVAADLALYQARMCAKLRAHDGRNCDASQIVRRWDFARAERGPVHV